MRIGSSILPLLLAGVAGISLAASASLAAGNTHELTVRLPGGGIERIEYTGNVAPRVIMSPYAWPAAFFAPALSFAAFDRMAAEMDREMAAFRNEAETLARVPANGGLDEAALRNLPPGAASWSMTSISMGDGFCSQSVEVTRPANGGKPQVVRHQSGNCAGANAQGTPSVSAPDRPGTEDIDARPANAPIPIRYEARAAGKPVL